MVKGAAAKKAAAPPPPPGEQPAVTKLEFKVGVITKVWHHPDADKLFCEEIDCGEGEPRQIASGLREHYTLEQMQGQRLLVVANLKAKNLKGFKSHGMVLCAAAPKPGGGELVEFVEPPAGAPLGEVVAYEGLDPGFQPVSAAQVEKKKVFEEVMPGLATNAAFEGTWEGHRFMTTAGACKAKTIVGGKLR